MLCQLIVKNFKSIKDEIILDMQATAISEHKDSLITDRDGEVFLPIGAIYGPNGSGKSNVIEAIAVLENKIMKPVCSVCEQSDCRGKEIKKPIVPFMLDKTSGSKPTEFIIFFRTFKAEYRYILHTLKEKIIFESLDKKNIDGKRYSSLFERSKKNILLKGAFKKYRIPADISDTITTLSFLAITNGENEIIKDVMGWFEGGIVITNYGNPFNESRIAIPTDKKNIELVVKLLREMDIDISNLRTEELEDDSFEVFTEHIVDDEKYELLLSDESSGTRKILGFLPDILNSIINGTTLCVDELDSKLHPILIRYLIDLYTDRKINKKGAQLIFTSHDLANMNNEVYRRDEIWFVAKNNEQATNLYSLVELKDSEGNGIGKDARYNKQYLEGKYGADPFLKKIIDWSEC